MNLFLKSYLLQKTLDHFLSIVFLMALTVIAVAMYREVILISDVAARVASVGDLKTDVQYHYALHGEWPHSFDNIERSRPDSVEYASFYGDTLKLEDGVVHIETTGKRLSDETISLQPAISSGNPIGPVVWIVGRGLHQDFKAVGRDKTTVSPEFIPRDMR